LNRWVPRRQ